MTRPKLPRNVWILGFVSLLMDLSSEIYHALLPVFITVTLGLPVVAMGAIDGIAEATASFAKLASGRLSDSVRRRKPLILLGYGMAAVAKPLFPLAAGALPILLARFVDRVGKGIRGAPRDAMIADETPPQIRGAAFGLRQSLDTVGALLAPLAAVGLMLALAGDIRLVFWIAVVPAVLSFLLAWLVLREPRSHRPAPSGEGFIAGFRSIDRATRRLLAVAFLFMVARFSEGFLILEALELGVSPALAPLALVLFNLGYVALAYPAGSLSDRIAPATILKIGIVVLIAADILIARQFGLAGLAIGILLWGGHMALTQGVLARMIADTAPEPLRATSFGAFHFVSGIGALLASLGAGWLWTRYDSPTAFLAGAAVAAVSLAMLSLLPNAERPIS